MSEGANAKVASLTAPDKKEMSIHAMNQVFHNTTIDSEGKCKSFWTVTKETMSMADGGKTKATDILVKTEPAALVATKAMVQEAKKKNVAKRHPHPGM